MPLAQPPERYKVTVVAPCRNKEGNVAAVAKRVPEMGDGTEIVFVDDASTDATAERVAEIISAHPEHHTRLARGPGAARGRRSGPAWSSPPATSS
jgi:dolichol-phosphate mannosyltransferase